ncbi:unnamed protein product [Pleuronectes platessa]|uniref:Uncharacterized protein n=1 Tax=Pleuronectes platessa TaxID=8262 RepID=A0A9N7UIS0_PLEPL|nr:unnamed protein product [Pleuronectes platessa]
MYVRFPLNKPELQRQSRSEARRVTEKTHVLPDETNPRLKRPLPSDWLELLKPMFFLALGGSAGLREGLRSSYPETRSFASSPSPALLTSAPPSRGYSGPRPPRYPLTSHFSHPALFNSPPPPPSSTSAGYIKGRDG